jgi:hypothetical protein
MKHAKKPTLSISLLICLALIASPLAAQQRKDSAPSTKPATKADQPSQPAATFDTLLAADSYKIYAEIKNVGQLVRSPNVSDIIDPFMKLAGPPKEFKLLVRFANAHAETLASSRMLLATWPAKPKLPQFVLAIEFASSEEARKFEPQLRDFLPKIISTPTPSPTAESSPTARAKSPPSPTSTEAKKPEAGEAKQSESKPEPPPFLIKQVGNLVLLSDTAVNFPSLRPADSKLLAEDANFHQVRDRFQSDPIFVYFNVALDDKSRQVVATVQQDSPKTKADEAAEEQAEKSDNKSTDMVPPEAKPEIAGTSDSPPIDTTNQTEPTLSARVAPPAQADEGSQKQELNLDHIYFSLIGSIFGGQPKWPEAVGAAISLDAESYDLRVLLVNGPGPRPSAVPFIPHLVSGPALTLESPSILPDDTELFVAASLDAPLVYESMVKTIDEQNAQFEKVSREPGRESELPFAALEKRLGIKIKEELLPVLGNEIAVSVPVASFTGGSATATTNSKSKDSDQPSAKKNPASPVVLISLKDKEAARILLPKVIDGLGFKGTSMIAQHEKHDDAEIVSYANVFSYAFVGNFLVLSLDASTTRHVVDSYLNHQTLSSDNHFRNYTRWQPRQLIGQIYVSPALMENYRNYANQPTALLSDTVRDFLLHISPIAEPVTYALSNESPGPLHELHVPKNLVLIAVAGIASEANQSPLMANEAMARVALSVIASSEASYWADKGHSSYATLEQLVAEGSVQKELLENHGYRIELTVSGDKFEASAVPVEYGKTGRLSYFVNESVVVRGADHAGGPATVADPPVQ